MTYCRLSILIANLQMCWTLKDQLQNYPRAWDPSCDEFKLLTNKSWEKWPGSNSTNDETHIR